MCKMSSDEVKILALAARSQRPLNTIEKLRHGTLRVHYSADVSLSQRVAAAGRPTSILNQPPGRQYSTAILIQLTLNAEARIITRLMGLTTKTPQ